MHNLVYLSTAVKLFTDDDLANLLTVARKNNAEKELTGILLYSEGTFLQVLEGAEEDIDDIFSKISKDRRHKNIIILIEDDVDERSFSTWSMGFTPVKPAQFNNLLGFIKPADQLHLTNSGNAVVTTLKTFIDSNKLNIHY